MKIYELKSITDNAQKAFEKLIPQLSSSCEVPTRKCLEAIVNSDSVFLFVAEEKNEIVGTLTLVINKIPTGDKVWIEDVVVDKSVRGNGFGKKLIQFAIEFVHSKNIEKINLTSSPERIAANALYQNMGFVKRETNVYRLSSPY